MGDQGELYARFTTSLVPNVLTTTSSASVYSRPSAPSIFGEDGKLSSASKYALGSKLYSLDAGLVVVG